MNHRHVWILLLGFLCLFAGRQIAAALTPQDIVASPEGIRIKVTEQTLQEILHRLEEMSGIRFEFSQAIGQIPITTTVTASDWPTAVRELLRPFSTAEVWKRGRLSQIFILTRGNALPAAQPETQGQESDGQKWVGVEVEKEMLPPTAPLPPPPPPPPSQ